MTSAETSPSTVVDAEASTLVMVSDFITFCKSRSTPPAKTAGFAIFGVIALDDAHAAERFRQAARDFGVDLAALAKDGTDGLESVLQNKDKHAQHGEYRERNRDAAMQQVDEGENRGEHAAEELHQARCRPGCARLRRRS